MRKRVLTILTVMIMAAALAACGTGKNAAQAADDASAYDESDDSIPFDEGQTIQIRRMSGSWAISGI